MFSEPGITWADNFLYPLENVDISVRFRNHPKKVF